MASVIFRSGKWFLKFRDHRGRWVRKTSSARTKTEARRLADDLERRCERQRLGLEPVLDETGGGTLAELLAWWLDTYSVKLASHDRNVLSVKKHLLGSDLARLRLVEITPGAIEQFLQAKGNDVGPQTVNHIRAFVMSRSRRPRRPASFSDPTRFATCLVARFLVAPPRTCAPTRSFPC
jgi:hypothetical protein